MNRTPEQVVDEMISTRTDILMQQTVNFVSETSEYSGIPIKAVFRRVSKYIIEVGIALYLKPIKDFDFKNPRYEEILAKLSDTIKELDTL